MVECTFVASTNHSSIGKSIPFPGLQDQLRELSHQNLRLTLNYILILKRLIPYSRTTLN
jgi:hypothetical protein